MLEAGWLEKFEARNAKENGGQVHIPTKYPPAFGQRVAKVVISRINHDLRVEVRDEGKGISTGKRWKMEIPGRAGVGIRGMRERESVS